MQVDEFTAVVIISGIVLVWYLTGLAYNRRKLATYWRNLNAELVESKANPKLRNIQPNSITISVGNLSKNLVNATLSVVVIGRQNPFSFAFALAQKRQDTLSLKADLKSKPTLELELLNRSYHLTPSLLEHAFKDWGREEIPGTEFIYCWPYGKVAIGSELKGVADFWRISIRKGSPHVLGVVRAGDPKSGQLSRWVKGFDDFLVRTLELGGSTSKR